ncbi:MAG: T9SS type A sorting domain-containing protein [Bacteroidetes bacterium SB0662_bin_6]|nr:T9SS type A sorting domain-containing protein [Bacteroidetes bacterium SB0668_bin_1]MYE03912.1 T9SS type A sorting domain-containing protein [Bacteroidetes bacterium SB0662_bin_6]
MRLFTTTKARLASGFALFLMLAFAAGFGAQDALAQRTVTLHLNTASAPDTLTTMHGIQVRGSLTDANGHINGPDTLPDGNVIDWNNDTTLRPMNMGGDYWYVSFQLPNENGLEFKFAYPNLVPEMEGDVWEDGQNNHVIEAGTDDVEMTLHFFNKSGGDLDYDWRPYEPAGTDSIAVWFRVFAYTDGSVTAGYDRADAAQTAEVRGDDQTGGPLTWNAMTGVKLAKESDDDTQPGYDLYSGVGYFPASAAGTEQLYKFVVGANGWEPDIDGGNRTFVIPEADTTLHWVYFGNTDPITSALVEGSVIFAVDTKPLEDINVFDLARGDSLEVRGDFNGWNCGDPTLCQLLRVPGSTTFENPVVLTLISGAELSYKFYINFHDANFENAFGVTTESQGGGFGWEEPITRTGANRLFTFAGTADQELDPPVQYFNDIADANIIPPGTSVELTMSVDMTSAVDPVTADPFVAGRDSVVVSFNDAIWRFTMNLPRTDEDGWRNDGRLYLLDPDGDNVYTATVTIGGVTRNDIALGTYSGLQYKYQYINPDAATESSEQGGGFGDLGRNRVRYIVPNADGSWPASFTFDTDMYQEEGLLPFEENPATVTSVEPVGAELPTQVTLGANYPNPFNPVTTFEYAIDQAVHVTLKVYDTLGREVATLVDGVQQAANYQVRFDGTGLASGMYLYRLETPGQMLTRRMILMK